VSHPYGSRTWDADRSLVHGDLGLLFGLLWLASAYHLLIWMHREVWEWGFDFIASCAAPPLYPVVALATGNFKGAAIFAALLAPVAATWWYAARRPSSRARSALAAAVIVIYWLFLDFGLAFSA
jgi:hypothetical protein